jgi:hypothetical protein
MKPTQSILLALGVWLTLMLALVFAVPATSEALAGGPQKFSMLTHQRVAPPPTPTAVPCPSETEDRGEPPTAPPTVRPMAQSDDPPAPMHTRAQCEPMQTMQEQPPRPAEPERTGA